MGLTYRAVAVTEARLAELLAPPETMTDLIFDLDDVAVGHVEPSAAGVEAYLSRDYKAMLFDADDVPDVHDLVLGDQRLPAGPDVTWFSATALQSRVAALRVHQLESVVEFFEEALAAGHRVIAWVS